MRETKKILFICSADKDRSKRTEDYFSGKYQDFNFRSAGTNIKLCNQLGTRSETEEYIDWAHVVYDMEQKHSEL